MRIWIARPEPGATRTAERLVGMGHVPLVAPVLVVEANDASPPQGRFDGVLVTSANALRQASRWRHLHDVPVFAVGARSAALARESGFSSVRNAEGDAVALAALVRREVSPGSSLLHAVGEDRKAEPGASLTEAGFRVTTFVAYGARPLASLPAEVAMAFGGPGALTGMLHYSRRSAATACELSMSAGYGGAFAALRHYCLSADVAAPLAQAGIAPYFVSEQANEDALLAGLKSGF
ncbi:uroporphyrinogen-III synthase [Methylobacterium sp. 77]|uniref:uroporphyrinogen-III synthase n=1 Tax=Methylobacterium sp. 77 TaxID=1101192 RepID=UPI00047C3491|nr:uroporphyrinogen-III synthase [Methylobacterium sp. 77]